MSAMLIKIPAGLLAIVEIDFPDADGVAREVESPLCSSSDETVAVASLAPAASGNPLKWDLILERKGLGSADISVHADADLTREGESLVAGVITALCEAPSASSVRFGKARTEADPSIAADTVKELTEAAGADATAGAPAEVITPPEPATPPADATAGATG